MPTSGFVMPPPPESIRTTAAGPCTRFDLSRRGFYQPPRGDTRESAFAPTRISKWVMTRYGPGVIPEAAFLKARQSTATKDRRLETPFLNRRGIFEHVGKLGESVDAPAVSRGGSQGERTT